MANMRLKGHLLTVGVVVVRSTVSLVATPSRSTSSLGAAAAAAAAELR